MSAAAALAAEIMARPATDRLGYALDLLDYYLDPLPSFFDALHDVGLRLSASDARLLHLLYRRRGSFVSLQALLAAAMGDRPVADWPDISTVYARLSNLRRACKRAGLPIAIRAWAGIGYRLEAPQDFELGGMRHAG
tara:strand:- start:149 stop:559 length:411 start_codon:yes stop_codon:yes gene_type:complete